MNENKALIIAEAGVNHNGETNKALELVEVAAECGADIIKFQTFKAKDLILKNVMKTKYQIKNTRSTCSQYEMLKSLEMTEAMHEKIFDHCSKKNIEFLSSAFTNHDLDYLFNLGVKRIKIPSGEITNLPYLEKTATFGIPIIISTGMSSIEEIKTSYKILIKSGVKNKLLTFLHCISDYPTKLDSINLKAMNLISEELMVDVGFSDHSIGNEAAIAAVALGAKIIEKHITLDKNLKGPDHMASTEPPEFKKLVESIRKVEKILGRKEKFANSSELENSFLVRKSIVASKNIKKGELLSSSNLTTKRPGKGLSPMLWYEIIGKKASKDYKIDEFIIDEN